jgi:hypothetical protein
MRYWIEINDDNVFTLQIKEKNETQIYEVLPENGLLHDSMVMQIDVLVNMLVLAQLDTMMDTQH